MLHHAVVVHKIGTCRNAHIHQLLPNFRVVLQEEQVCKVRRSKKALAALHNRRKAVVRLPDVVDPKKFEGLEQLHGLIRLLCDEAQRHFVAPEAECRNEAEEQRHGNEHRQAAAPHAHPAFLHELLLLAVHALGIVLILFLQALDFRLDGLHFHGGFARFDVGKNRKPAQNNGADQNRKKYAADVFIKPAHRLQEPCS